MVVVAPDGTVRFSNCRLAGIEARDSVGKSFHELVEPGCRDALREAVSRTAETGNSTVCEIELKDANDGPRFYQTHLAPALGPDGLIGVTLISSDTTEHRQAERALQRHAELDQALAMVSTEFINLDEEETDIGIQGALETVGALCDADRSFLFLFRDDGASIDKSHEWCAWGIEPRGAKPARLEAAAYPWWVQKLSRLEVIRISDVGQLPAEARRERRFLKVHRVRSILTVPLVLAGELYGFLGLAWTRRVGSWSDDDIRLLRAAGEIFTGALERGAAARQLREARDELELRVRERTGELRRLSAQLVSAQEAERKRISRELHDEMGQALTALGINLAAVARDQSSKLSPDSAARLSESSGLADEMLERVRELTLELRPSLLDDLGLVPTVRWYANRFAKRLGIEVELELEGLRERLPALAETALYRVMQEALTNVARHADATRVLVTLERNRDCVAAAITDNGKGFSVAGPIDGQQGSSGTGLVGIRERLSALGGTVRIDSEPGEGTRLFVELPLFQGDEQEL